MCSTKKWKWMSDSEARASPTCFVAIDNHSNLAVGLHACGSVFVALYHLLFSTGIYQPIILLKS